VGKVYWLVLVSPLSNQPVISTVLLVPFTILMYSSSGSSCGATSELSRSIYTFSVEVGVIVGFLVLVGVMVSVGVRVTVAVEVDVGVFVDVGVLVSVGVLVDVGVFVGVGVLVSVDVGAGEVALPEMMRGRYTRAISAGDPGEALDCKALDLAMLCQMRNRAMHATRVAEESWRRVVWVCMGCPLWDRVGSKITRNH
jgi:hypothetical protein